MSQNSTKNKKIFHISMKAKERTSELQFSALTKLKKELNLSEKKLHTAVVTNNTEAVAKLLACGVNPNATDNLLRSPLHLSASRGYKEVVSVLIKYGADPNQKDIIGNTPLHLAACTNNIEIVTLLLDAGTDVSSLDQFGRNPLQLAQSKLKLIRSSCKTGHVELAQLRLQIQQVIDLMLSFLRRRGETNVDELKIMKLELETDAQLDDQLSSLLNAIQGISIK